MLLLTVQDYLYRKTTFKMVVQYDYPSACLGNFPLPAYVTFALGLSLDLRFKPQAVCFTIEYPVGDGVHKKRQQRSCDDALSGLALQTLQFTNRFMRSTIIVMVTVLHTKIEYEGRILL